MRDIEAQLTSLEESLREPDTRFDIAHMAAVLGPGFVEFGRSGRIYDRAEIMAVEPADFHVTLPLPDLAVRLVTDDVALVTCRSEVHRGANERELANRASIWRRTPAGWLLEFHQGTPVNP